jgi:hypothetical protein
MGQFGWVFSINFKINSICDKKDFECLKSGQHIATSDGPK